MSGPCGDQWCSYPECGCPGPEPEPAYDPGPLPLAEDPEQPGDGAQLLDDVHEFISRFVAFPSGAAAVAVTLWAAHCHAPDSFESTPRIALLSPEPGSGKTRTLEVLELLTPRPMHALNASVAAIFRSIENARPTLLIDECDAIFTKRGKDDANEELRALLNAGHRHGAKIPRCTGPLHDVRLFPVYAATALAGLGDLPATLMSRSVVIRMRRRAPGEHVEAFRIRTASADAEPLADRLAAWMKQEAPGLAETYPDMPPGITDRPADVWEPLLAVADAAGGDWPKRARDACTELAGAAETGEASLGVRLLGDLRDVLGDTDTLPTALILDRLHAIEEAPWGSFGKPPKPLDARGLANRLRAYGIRSVKVKEDGKPLQGYRRADLWDAWQRYLPPVPAEAEPPEPPEPPWSEDPPEVPDAGPVPEPQTGDVPEVPEPLPLPEPQAPAVTCDVPQVPQVPDLREPETCTVCGELLDPVLVEHGYTTHGEDEAAPAAPGLRKDTHEEQERLYPARLAIRRKHDSAESSPSFLPTRTEWVDPEAARHAVVTQCFPYERVPRGIEHYLSPAELDELETLKRELCQSVRPLITAEINRVRALLPSKSPGRVRERVAWYLALGKDDQATAERLSLLEDARRDLGRMLRDGGPCPHQNPLLRDSFTTYNAAELIPDQGKLRRYTSMLDSADSARNAAGQAAEDAAVAAEQARRLTDEGWAAELHHRESLEEYFTQGPVSKHA